MNKQQDEFLITAMMLLESIGGIIDKDRPNIEASTLDTPEEMMWAAHSYIQAARNNELPEEYALALHAKIIANSALREASKP